MLKKITKGLLFTALLTTMACSPEKNSADLNLAINNRQVEASLQMIKQGVDVNAQDSTGMTPLHYSARRALPAVTEQLIQKGADVNHKDGLGYTPLNYAIRACNQQVIQLLLENGAVSYHNDLPNLTDGPFVDYNEKGMYAYYLKHDSIAGTSSISGKQFDPTTKSIAGWDGDKNIYSLQEAKVPAAAIKTTEPIFVLGDIHGQYDRMVRNLKTNGVINEQLEWNWGKGHLVFVGDIMDRGNKVTDALWLIYRLEQEAEKAGGKVHLIFGNHELMVLNNDNRYIAPDYKTLCKNLGLNYASLFHPNSVLGEWLRSKNSITQINDLLFVHGGISKKLIESGLTMNKVNQLMRNYFVAGSNPQTKEAHEQILRSFGPFWYRGYFMKRSKYPKITEKELDSILEDWKISTIVVGHTETELLSSSFNGKVIDVNIPLWNDEIPNQALLIKEGKFYHLTESGERKLLK